jgi:hypothetical protein
MPDKRGDCRGANGARENLPRSRSDLPEAIPLRHAIAVAITKPGKMKMK